MKKVLLSSVVALTVFSAFQTVSADNGVENGVVPKDKQYNPAKPVQNPYEPGHNLNPDGTPKRVVPNGTHARINVKDRLGAPVAGVTVDFLVNGVASQAVTDANGDASIAAPAGTTVRYRVAAAPAGYFQNVNQEGAIVVGGDMFTNEYLVIEKTDSYLNPNYTPGSDNKPADAPKAKDAAKDAAKDVAKVQDEAKKSESKAGAAAQAGKADSKQAGKALPKTSAAK